MELIKQQDSYEEKVIYDFTSHRQNTHKRGISSSVGKAILTLKDIYFKGMDEKKIEEEYQHWIKKFIRIQKI